MRILKLKGYDDYAVLNFCDENGNPNATEVMDNLDKYKSEEELWLLEVVEVEGEISDDIRNFVNKNAFDYDDSKHRCFYFEGETIDTKG